MLDKQAAVFNWTNRAMDEAVLFVDGKMFGGTHNGLLVAIENRRYSSFEVQTPRKVLDEHGQEIRDSVERDPRLLRSLEIIRETYVRQEFGWFGHTIRFWVLRPEPDLFDRLVADMFPKRPEPEGPVCTCPLDLRGEPIVEVLTNCPTHRYRERHNGDQRDS